MLGKPPLISDTSTTIWPDFRAAPLFPNLDCNLCPTLQAHSELLIRWPINRSNRFSDFLRLDRLDRYDQIIKSIFSKFWKREFQVFSDFQNFFGFLKFRGIFVCFWYSFQISRRYGMCRCSLSVNVDRCGSWGLWFTPTKVSRNLYKLENREKGFVKGLLRFTRTCTTHVTFFDVKFEHLNLQGSFCELLSHTTSLYLMIFVTGSYKKWRSGILWPQ